ncbi:uncharacterized protein [Diadema setosum]|uniref:uncharacterized protein n=1 Tax=Diadema setosum TaxID=31175 RepID=UPI003B3AD612
MALVDADFKFVWIDVGGHRSMSDAQIYNASELKGCLEDGIIDFPDPDPMPNDDQDMPYFLLGDDAFGLRTYLMKPFSHRGLTEEELITNYRISRGRRVLGEWICHSGPAVQVLLTTMMQGPDTVRLIIKTCICLHNLMRREYPDCRMHNLTLKTTIHPRHVERNLSICRTLKSCEDQTETP